MATMNNDNNLPPTCSRSVQSDEKQVIAALPVSSYIINRMGRHHMQPEGILATDVGMYDSKKREYCGAIFLNLKIVDRQLPQSPLTKDLTYYTVL